MNSEVKPHMWLPEPQLSFHPDRSADRSRHPLRGLLQFGPYSAGLVPDPLRVATLAPAGESGRLYDFMRDLKLKHTPKERTEYLPKWPGFHDVFGLHMRAARSDCRVRSLDLYRRRHAGRSPRRVMVHKNTAFRREEVGGCMEALHLCESVDLVQVVEDVGWRAVHIDSGPNKMTKGKAVAFPVSRGTVVALGPREALLWTHGDVQGITNRSYFQGSRSTPKPVRLVRHAGHGPWDETVRAILGLSKMNWNNDSLYDSLPVTMAYAKVLARVVKRMPSLGSTPYQFRFFM